MHAVRADEVTDGSPAAALMLVIWLGRQEPYCLKYTRYKMVLAECAKQKYRQKYRRFLWLHWQRQCAGYARPTSIGPVWTAPAVQEESDILAKGSGAVMYSAFECGRLATGPDVIR